MPVRLDEGPDARAEVVHDKETGDEEDELERRAQDASGPEHLVAVFGSGRKERSQGSNGKRVELSR